MDLRNTYVYILFLANVILSLAVIFFLFEIIVRKLIDAIKRKKIKTFFKGNVITNDKLTGNYKRIYKDVNQRQLDDINISNIEALKDELYDIFYRFEVAYNSLDYSSMKSVSTSQLYSNYYTDISLDLKVGEKRIITDIEKKRVVLYDIINTSVRQTFSLLIEVSYINYKIDKFGQVISGKRFKPITEKFEVTFKKNIEQESIIKCPNCGAKITGNKCDYCRTPIKDVEFKISSIKRIID